MRIFIAVLSVSLSLVALGCGEDSSTSYYDSEAFQAKVKKVLEAPKIKRPEGPPPKKLVIKDLKVGSGEIAKKGDRVTFHYIAAMYHSGGELTNIWPPFDPTVYPSLGSGKYPGIEMGIEGMREGGRRKVISPSHLAFGNGAIIYLILLKKVEAGPRPD